MRYCGRGTSAGCGSKKAEAIRRRTARAIEEVTFLCAGLYREENATEWQPDSGATRLANASELCYVVIGRQRGCVREMEIPLPKAPVPSKREGAAMGPAGPRCGAER